MSVLITLLILCAILAVAYWAFNQLSLPPPIRMVAVVIVAILAILILLQLAPGIGSGVSLHLR